MPTKIEWTDEAWNPVTGCTKIGDGCRNCYAERMATRLRGRCGYPADDPFRVTVHPERFTEPLRWRKPRRVFVCSMGDLFHEDVGWHDIDEVLAVAANTPRHTYQILTKRPKRMATHFKEPGAAARINRRAFEIQRAHHGLGRSELTWPGLTWPLPNVWLGVSVWDQPSADAFIPSLIDTPAAGQFVSVEPMLGPIDLRIVEGPEGDRLGDSLTSMGGGDWPSGIDWVICGGETGPGARPMHPDWARSLRDQCAEAGVPFFFKQWGEYCYLEQMPDGTYVEVDSPPNLAGHGDHHKPFRVGKKRSGRLLDGKTHDAFPTV